ncbi:MspA family porin [Rhodococcus sp. IEGM 1379]|uniref:MspA family porin n=1 Tax=Rhodococcus sp. IEGM 1379 TaxID=3047086 RepID=UPI0024B65087|nr:MspA family porin [Rhodococcus sp. IEGM 1379]MDI9916966.1 MspA family porin [Rhodococcus sp. IEGM 1379]
MTTTRACDGEATKNSVGRRSRIGVVGAVAALAIALGSTSASAGVDNASSIVDSKGNRIEVLQMDTSIHSVPPLDSSPLSVEFFHDGIAGVKIDGPGADSFTGTKLTIGYQIGYPIALAGATVVLNTPGLDWGVTGGTNLGIGDIVNNPILGLDISNGFVIGGDIIPSQELDVDLTPGGITDVALLSDQSFDGPEASVRLSGVHGYVQGALGPVTIRPYAKAVTSNGDTVVTYGVPQRL